MIENLYLIPLSFIAWSAIWIHLNIIHLEITILSIFSVNLCMHYDSLTLKLHFIFCIIIKSALGQGNFLSSSSSLHWQPYCDFDWACGPMSHKFVTGYCVFFGYSLISCKRRKQCIISRSSTKSKYRSMASTTSELLWLKYLLTNLGVSHSQPL